MVVVLRGHVVVVVWLLVGIALIGRVVAVNERLVVVVVLLVLVDQVSIGIRRDANVSIEHGLSLHRPHLAGKDEHGDD